MRISLRPTILKPLASKRASTWPTSPRCTPSGLTMMSVRSTGIYPPAMSGCWTLRRATRGPLHCTATRGRQRRDVGRTAASLVATDLLGEAQAGLARLHADAAEVGLHRAAH